MMCFKMYTSQLGSSIAVHLPLVGKEHLSWNSTPAGPVQAVDMLLGKTLDLQARTEVTNTD